ncbi:hypothetical protein MT355_14960 [Rathayibacter sp. VKM Ac-2929]|uniref:hypothetical protein n=2 Tax=unclassified Rathayibacter TaxID=2609250 RepID=UPI001FB231D4|nr:hypothetical protein [Rathayibacter sp. VKM Ac-2929]MCJ1674558.1 hypothetical protein [Rathayibacter sp. VKM Ac-2929]
MVEPGRICRTDGEPACGVALGDGVLMRVTRITLGIAGAVLAAAAVATTMGVSAAQDGGDGPSTPEQTARTEPATAEPAVSREEASAERVENFPALQPYDGSQPLVPVAELVGSARAVVDVGAEKSPVYAALLSYGDLRVALPSLASDVQISADRPVYVLTVHHTIQNWGALSGTVAKTWDVYTLVCDGPTGDTIASGTGTDIEALGIEGEYVE